jgi:uncharacterized Rmd1/YagE family protein
VPPTISAVATLLAERISRDPVPGFERAPGAAQVLHAPGGGNAVVFRYGAVVCFGMSAHDRARLYSGLRLREPLPTPIEETVDVDVVDGSQGTIADGRVQVPALHTVHLQVIGEALAKSVVLEHQERLVAQVFSRIEPLAVDLQKQHAGVRRAGQLLEHIGGALLAQLRMVGGVEVREKPDVLWDHPELERLYARLADEFELRERAVTVEQKLQLVMHTAQTALDLLQQRRSLRVEWYIVALIVVELALSLYQMLVGTG